jgi:hypothetical protein
MAAEQIDPNAPVEPSSPAPPSPPKPKEKSKPATPPAKHLIVVNPLFKLLVAINIGLCLMTFAVMVAIWIWGSNENPAPRAQENLYNTCETVFKMTAGAFIGLLGGRAAAPDGKK